jgi:hypothetical protein
MLALILYAVLVCVAVSAAVPFWLSRYKIKGKNA